MTPTALELAQAHLRRGDADAALRAVLPVLDAPDAADATTLKLLLRLALRGGLLPVAARAMRIAMARFSDDAELHALAAAGAEIAGDAAGTERSARRALQLDAREPLATALLLRQLSSQLRFGDALELADAAIEAAPDDANLRVERANLLLFAGDARLAMDDATQATRLADAPMANQLAALVSLYEVNDDAAGTLRKQRQWAARIPGYRLPPPGPRSGKSLRIGLLSPDFRQHPVGQLVQPLLLQDVGAAVFAYHDGATDAYTGHLRGGSSTMWRDCRGLDDAALLRLMQADRIDVLIDLAGHSAGARARVLASRIASRQYGYLGHLSDPGFDTCDGVIGDAWCLPAGTAAVRHALRLAAGFLCFTAESEAPSVAVRGRLQARGPVFGSFNHLAKLCPRTVALWSELLRTAPGARLVLCALGLADVRVRERTLARFAAHGIETGRIDLRPPVLDRGAFLSQYGDIDVALDPLPFNGGFTTLQALWQGVPVVSLPGQRMAARTGASILSRLGLGEMLAADEAQYVQTAVALAQDEVQLLELRRRMRERMLASGITDQRAFARAFVELAGGTDHA